MSQSGRHFRNTSQVLSKLLESGPAKVPVSAIDLKDDEPGFEDDRVWDHWIVDRISVLRDIQILSNDTPRIGQEGPVSSNAATIFICLDQVVGAYRDQAAIADLQFAMKLV